MPEKSQTEWSAVSALPTLAISSKATCLKPSPPRRWPPTWASSLPPKRKPSLRSQGEPCPLGAALFVCSDDIRMERFYPGRRADLGSPLLENIREHSTRLLRLRGQISCSANPCGYQAGAK